MPINLPSLIPASGGAVLALPDGTTRRTMLEQARALFRSGEVVVAHAGFVAGRLRVSPSQPLFDVLDLFAYVRPAQSFVPSAIGLARVLGLEFPHTPEACAVALRDAADALIEELQSKYE